MTQKEKENRIHSFALEFLERQQIVPNLYADQIIKGYKEGYLQAEQDLEAKEANLEKELDYNDYTSFFKEHPDYNDGSWGFDECWVFAEYFYKLGIKAQRGE